MNTSKEKKTFIFNYLFSSSKSAIVLIHKAIRRHIQNVKILKENKYFNESYKKNAII